MKTPNVLKNIISFLMICFFCLNAYSEGSYKAVVDILEEGTFDQMNLNPFVKEFHNDFLRSYYLHCQNFIANPTAIVTTHFEITTDEFGYESKSQNGAPTTIYVDSRYAKNFESYFNEGFTPGEVWRQIRRIQDNTVRKEIEWLVQDFKDNQGYMNDYLSNNCSDKTVEVVLENLYRFTHSLPALIDVTLKESSETLPIAESRPIDFDDLDLTDLTTLKSGLQYKILKPGNGPQPTSTSLATMHYAIWLTTGQKVDSSWDRKAPLEVVLNKVIKGWGNGASLINKGGRILLVIPPDLAYGEQVAGQIPANSTLLVVIDLLSFSN